VVLVAGAGLLYSSTPQQTVPLERQPNPPTGLTPFIGITVTGMITGTLMTLTLRGFPAQLSILRPDFRAEYGTAAILLIAALATVPLETGVLRVGSRRSFFGSLIGLACLLLLAGWVSDPSLLQFGILPLLGVTLGLALISQIPFALTSVPRKQAGLITGLYFGGMSLGNILLSLI
jgi:hypothetical protein